MAEEDIKKLIEETAAETRRQVEQTAAETRRQIEEGDAATRRQIEQTAAETRRQIEEGDAATLRYVEQTAAETRRHFEKRLESISNKIDDNRRHAEIVAENLDHKIQVVAEVTNGKIESLRNDMNERFANVDRRFDDLEGAMGFATGELAKRLDDHETRIQHLESTRRPS